MLGMRDPFREFARFRESYPMLPALEMEEGYRARKRELVAGIGRAESLRDFGGMWGVHGMYLLAGARALSVREAEMVDFVPDEEFLRGVEELRETGATVTFARGDFRDTSLYERLKPVEVSLLYDVLLHQENAVQVIGNVLSRTVRWVCVAQPVLKEEVLPLPCGCVNLLFYPPELKDALHCEYWRAEPATERFNTRCWTWGQTVSYLTSVFRGYGWERRHLEAHDMSRHWAYALMRFAPRELGGATFADVPVGAPGFAEVEACVRAGLVQGFGGGLFEPEGVVTLPVVAVLLARAIAGGEEGVPPVTHTPTFSDVPEVHWAWRHIEYLHENGLIGGEPGGTCGASRVVPQDELAELAAAAARACGREPAAGYDAGFRAGKASTRRDMAVCIARAFWLVGK